MQKLILWTPRVLSIIFIIFLSLFSLDVFGSGLNAWQVALGLLIHNIPSLVLLIILIISWKYEIVGAVAFIGAGLLYIFLTVTSSINWLLALSWSLIIAMPAIFVGALFLLSWRNRRKK